ncbi:MAG: response regulator transcription factor [Armatimonadetes bacterium]|nr:response regulator transcription factor [Armatimonadota bacterium]
MRHSALLMMSPGRIRDQVAGRLRQHKVAAPVADNLVEGLQLLLEERPDVTVFDFTLDGVEGMDSCNSVGRHTDTHIIALGDENGRPPVSMVLDEGVDDYLSRPFGAFELVARVRALIRRLKEYSVAERLAMRCGDIVIDVHSHQVTVAGEAVDLTPKEFELLTALAARPGELVRREELLADVWGFSSEINSRTLDVHIGRLRRKIDRDGAGAGRIATVPRVGYRLAA